MDVMNGGQRLGFLMWERFFEHNMWHGCSDFKFTDNNNFTLKNNGGLPMVMIFRTIMKQMSNIL